MTKNIKISDWTKELLDEFKEVEEHTSLDSVIRSLVVRTIVEKSIAISDPIHQLDNKTYIKLYREISKDLSEPWPESYKKQLKMMIHGRE